MRICAVRSLKNGVGGDGAKRVLSEQPLDHETAMFNDTDAVGLWLECANDDEKELVNVCRHCGALYLAEEKGQR